MLLFKEVISSFCNDYSAQIPNRGPFILDSILEVLGYRLMHKHYRIGDNSFYRFIILEKASCLINHT